MKEDGHMVCDTCWERVSEDLAFLDHGSMMCTNEVVVKDRVGVRFSEKDVWSFGGGGTRKRPLVVINSKELIIFKSSRPL